MKMKPVFEDTIQKVKEGYYFVKRVSHPFAEL